MIVAILFLIVICIIIIILGYYVITLNPTINNEKTLIVNGWSEKAMYKLITDRYGGYGEKGRFFTGATPQKQKEMYEKMFSIMNVGTGSPLIVVNSSIDKQIDVTLMEAVQMMKEDGYDAFTRDSLGYEKSPNQVLFKWKVKVRRTTDKGIYMDTNIHEKR
jgi:hypothetical protein